MNPPLLTTTQAVDPIFWYIIGLCFASLLLVIVLMIWFTVRFHRSRHPVPTSQVTKNVTLELLWTLIPTLLALSMFYYGWAGYLHLRDVPEDAMEVSVTARMWSWLFEYENGRTSDRLYVPVGRPIKINIRTVDVIHSFYLPAFRVKRDAVPGMETYVWFVVEEPGSYDIFCAEYCGLLHADMITTMEALPPDDFVAWYEEEIPELEHEGLALLQRHGCIGCHSLDGTPGVGPTLQGMIGREVTVVTGGRERTLTADAEYIRRSILQPEADIVQGYPPVMPSYQGRISEEEIDKMIDFLEGGGPAAISGEDVVRKRGCVGCHSTDGSRLAGPTFQGLYGSEVTVVRNGKRATVKVDEEYIRRAIAEPGAEIAEGYPPIMPAFPDIPEAEMAAIVEYLRGLQ